MRQRETLHDEAVGVDDVGRHGPGVVGPLHDAGDLGAVADPLEAGHQSRTPHEDDEGDAVVEAVDRALGGGLLEALAQAEAAEKAQHPGCQGRQGELPENRFVKAILICI